MNNDNEKDNNDKTATQEHNVSDGKDFLDEQQFGKSHFCFHTKRLTDSRFKDVLSLDTGSSDHLFCQENMLKNLKDEKFGLLLTAMEEQ